MVGLAAAVLGVAAVAGCGGSSSGGSVTLNWFIANQPGGSIQEIAKRCTDESNGRYKVDVQLLPSDATQQREQLVRRLAAKDSTIDIVGMDVIWTAEFANAGWISQWPAALDKQVTQSVFPSVVKTASFEGKLYGAPFNSNTQLLWYRKDLVPKAPTTWDQMIDEAEKLASEGKPDTIQVQANKYEGLTVWVNALIASAGGQILTGPETRRPAAEADREGARGDGHARRLAGRGHRHLHVNGGQGAPRLRGGRLRLHGQLHVRLRERAGERPGRRQGDGVRRVPAGRARTRRPSRPSAGSTSASARTRTTRTWRSRRPRA